MFRIRYVLLAAAWLAPAAFAQSPDPTAPPHVDESIQVTATRLPADPIEVPASITVVTAAEIEARGAHDLASALSLAAGVAIAAGGDGGPASSVPELMGLREFDAFLLVVDGVPWGGAFIPALSSLELVNVDRIEILRGSAPVLYGATSFVGVIHVIHRSPRATPRQIEASLGSHGSGRVAVSAASAGSSAFQQSFSAAMERVGLAGDAGGFDRGHAFWSGVAQLGGGGRIRLVADYTGVRQDPSSPHPREGRSLTSRVALDANHNPSDARIDENRLHLVAGLDRPLLGADWSSSLAVTASERETVRGFLREDLDAELENAAGYTQQQEQADLYFDSHLAWKGDRLDLVAGIDLLAGRGEAESVNFLYTVGLDGSGRPSSAGRTVVERPEFEDERIFAGGYLQTLWAPTERWRVEAGARLNHVREMQEGEVETDEGEIPAEDERSDTRLSGGVGASFRLLGAAADAVWLFADWKDAFKPAAVDFGPEAEGEVLDPETATTIEAGVKGSHLDGRLTWQASAFRMDFENLVVARTVDGRPALENAGEQRFEGFEIEGRLRLADELTLQASFADHTAEFRDYVREFDGVPTQLRGKRLEMSPDRLAAFAITWSPARGPVGWAGVSYVGERFLDKRNRALAGDYTTFAAGAGYRFERAEVRVDADNLTDERPPVAESELGDAQYYRLPGRSFRLSTRWRL